MTIEERQQVLISDKKLDVIDEYGNIIHYNMNDYGWESHVFGYKDFCEKLISLDPSLDIKRIVNSKEPMDYYQLENILATRLKYLIHKSWVDDNQEYHHFCFNKSGLSNIQEQFLSAMKKEFNCIEDNLWGDEELGNMIGIYYAVDIEQIKQRI